LRAGGVSAACVAAAALDARGLTRLAVDESDVSRVRLAFPQPVVTLDDLPAGLRVILQPRLRVLRARTCHEVTGT
jgi:hypothetical protein